MFTRLYLINGHFDDSYTFKIRSLIKICMSFDLKRANNFKLRVQRAILRFERYLSHFVYYQYSVFIKRTLLSVCSEVFSFYCQRSRHIGHITHAGPRWYCDWCSRRMRVMLLVYAHLSLRHILHSTAITTGVRCIPVLQPCTRASPRGLYFSQQLHRQIEVPNFIYN